MTTTTHTDAATPVTITRVVTYGAVATGIAIAANALVRVVATALFDVPAGFGPLDWGPVVNTTVVGCVGATAVYGLIARVSNRPTRHFAGIAAVVLLVSFVPLLAPPAFLDRAPTSVLATLAAMHVTTAVALVGLLPRATKPGAP